MNKLLGELDARLLTKGPTSAEPFGSINFHIM
jgi:hypothetical protein